MKASLLLAHFDRVCDAPDAIPRLRRFIFDLAVRGRLVEQNLNDERRVIVPLGGEATPFRTPATWQWVRLSSVLESSFYGPRFGAEEYTKTGVPTIRTTDMTTDGRIVLRNPPKVKVEADRLQTFKCREGDLLITRTGSIGTMAVFNESYPAIPSAYLIRLRFTSQAFPRFIHLSLRSTYGREALGLNTTKVAQPNINAKNLGAISIPLPPLYEQRQIVAGVDELMTVCDRLEAQLANALFTKGCLLEAILNAALDDGQELDDGVGPS